MEMYSQRLKRIYKKYTHYNRPEWFSIAMDRMAIMQMDILIKRYNYNMEADHGKH